MRVCGTPETLLASEEVTRRYGKWRAPDEDKAALHYRAEHSHHDFFDVWSSRVRDFKEFGVGHMMYFYFLSWMAALFGVLAVITGIPNMALNCFGRYYDTGTLEMTTLGNFGAVTWTHNHDGPAEIAKLTNTEGWEREAFISNLFMNTSGGVPATHPINKQSTIIAMSVLDFVGVVVYFVVTFGLVWVARKLAHNADMHTVTIHDYSIRVERLPQDATADELADFFSQYGEVVHVEIIRAYGRLVRMVVNRGKLLRKLQSATAALQKEAQDWAEVPVSREAACYKVKNQIDQLSRDIQVEQSMADSHRVVGAFVTFKEEAGKLACLKAQPHSRMRQLWALKSEHKLRQRHALNITDAPEPSDVQYENIEHSTLERFIRAFLVACCSYTCLAAGFALISLASAMRLNLSKVAGVKTSDCSSSCRLTVNGALGLSSADRELYSLCGTTGLLANGTECAAADTICYRCYCLRAITSGMLEESVYCSGVANLLVLEYASQVMIVLVILFINTVLSITSRVLTLFEKHHTRSTEAKSLAHKLFLAQFLNSALSTIIANAHLPFLSNAMEGTVLDGLFFQGIFTDLTPNWYKLVGRSLVVSQFVGAGLRILNLIIRWVQAKYQYRNRHKCLTQHELQKTLRGPKFELDQRYGEHLNVIYVSMLLSGGMPISYIAAAFWFLTSYWCDKFELLTLSRRPITYGADLSNMVIERLPFAVVWHVIFALWAFSIYGVPRSALVTSAFASLISRVCTGMSVVWEGASSITASQATERLLAANSLHLLILLIILVGLLFINIIRSNFAQFGRWLLSMAGVIADKEEAELSGVPEFPVAVRTQLLVGESSYAIQAQPTYAAAFSRMEDAVGDVLVQVVMKKGAEMLASAGEIKGQTKQLSPRSPSELKHDRPTSSTKQLMQQAAAADGAAMRHTRTPQAAWQQEQTQQQPRLTSAQQQKGGASSVQNLPQGSSAVSTAAAAAMAGGYATPSEPAAATEAAIEPAGHYEEQLQQQQQQRRVSDASTGSARSVGTSERHSIAQKYRQARANQIMPVPEQYVAAARAADKDAASE